MTGPAARILVLGIGNIERGDDGIGRMVARALKDRLGGGVIVLEHDGEAASLLAQMEGASAVYLVDACVSGAPAGTVHRFDANAVTLPPAVDGISTHGFGLKSAIELGRALGQLPAHTIVFAIEGSCFAAGARPSQAVAEAAADVANRIEAEIAARAEEPFSMPESSL